MNFCVLCKSKCEYEGPKDKDVDGRLLRRLELLIND